MGDSATFVALDTTFLTLTPLLVWRDLHLSRNGVGSRRRRNTSRIASVIDPSFPGTDSCTQHYYPRPEQDDHGLGSCEICIAAKILTMIHVGLEEKIKALIVKEGAILEATELLGSDTEEQLIELEITRKTPVIAATGKTMSLLLLGIAILLPLSLLLLGTTRRTLMYPTSMVKP